VKLGLSFKFVAAGLVALLGIVGVSNSATAAASAQVVYSPNLSIQLATDYSFSTLAVNQVVPWGQTLDNQDHEFNLTK
jgi:hypothetical protein